MINGVPSGSTKMAGDTLCSGRPKVSRPSPGASRERVTVLPLASNGTWICDAVSDASRTGTVVSPVRADSTRAPNTLSKDPGAAGRAL